MDIEKQSQWAKSTESRIEIFLDSYVIRSPIQPVRSSSQRLILSLFKKGNEQQRLRIMSLLDSRCENLTWMGKASEEFLGLINNIFSSTEEYGEQKRTIIGKIFKNLETIHRNIISNPNYEFYSFASNLIDFGNQQFKPYLLEANGCLNCFGCTEPKSEPFKLDNCIQTIKIFNNKLEYVFKRIYEVRDLTMVLKGNSRMKAVTAYYLTPDKDYRKIGTNKFKSGESISAQGITLQGLLFEFDIAYIGHRKKVQCIFCDNIDDLNGVCGACAKRSEAIEITGNFRAVGADEQLISEQLCQDYQKIQQSISSIKNLHARMESKEKISLNFKVDEMMEVYQRIVNNLRLLHQKNPSQLKGKENKNCFSCNYYQIVNIVKFLKEGTKKPDRMSFQPEEVSYFKETLRTCLCKNQIESLKVNLLETLAAFIVNSLKPNYKQEFENPLNRFTPELIAKVLIALKEKRNISQGSIDEELTEIRVFLLSKLRQLSIQDKVTIFACYYLDWEFLSLVLSNTFNHATQINRLTADQFNQLKAIIDFDCSQVFNLNLNNYLKAFLKIIPAQILPAASLDIADCEFLQYVDNKIPEIEKTRIEESIICCPSPMIKLDMFVSLPILISKLPVHESMKVMNSLFPFRSAWNLNVMKACKKFEEKLVELPAEEQIATCLEGYCKSKEYLYIHKIFKLLVPQRMQFIIRLEAPQSQIEANNIEYPYLPIKEVKSEDLQGDTIRALHDWVYAELGKLNQAMPLDIIVEKSIIDNMDFPIELIYQNIVTNKSKKKIGDKQYEFFRVIYRIQGIMGEPKERSIGNLRDQRLETCISYASYFLNKFSEEFNKIGLDILIQILEEIQPGPDSEDKKVVLFEILSTLSMNEAICKKIVEGQYGDSIINATVKLMSFQNEKDAKITNFLLQLSSKVIDEANQEMINLRKGSVGHYRKMSGMENEQTGGLAESEKKVRYVLQKITECQRTYEKSGNVLYRDIAKRLIKLLPFCSKDETQSSSILFNFFQFSSWASKHSSKMENLFVFMESLSQSYMTFKCIVNQKGITNEITRTITNAIRKEGKDQVDEKKISVNKGLTESALLLLCSLVQGDQKLQASLFQSKIFHNIYDISLISPKKAVEINAGRVPENCYKIIKYLTEGKIINSQIHQFLEEKKKIEKQRKEPKKNKKWEMMKNKQKLALEKRMEDEAEEDQKDIIICSSCQEGYSKKKEILGLYIYQTKNEIPLQNNWWKDSRRVASFTSTTYFTAIHFECHNKAFEADQKIHRPEWDGALIRNMDVLCNSWLPLKGPKTTSEEFSRVERKYFERNKNGNFWNVVNDLYGLLEKLSIEFDFATESKGSSASHNCRLIPILIGFACHLIERAGGCASIEEGIAYLLENSPKKLTTVNYMACYSIFACNYEWFQKNKLQLFKWIVALKDPEVQQQKAFESLKPYLLFLKMVEQIFETIHKPMSNQSTTGGQKVFKQVEQFLSNNLQLVVGSFEKLSEQYKVRYTKFTTVEDFEL